MKGVILQDSRFIKRIKKRESTVQKEMGGDRTAYSNVEYYPLITSRSDDATNFSMRIYKIGANGHTGTHKHSYEHEVYVLKGKGCLLLDGIKLPIEKDDYFIIHPYEFHQLLADEEMLEFICIVPNKLKNQPE